MHPNTVRAWSEAGRLRYYRINERGDRRYRLGDLQRFLAAAESPVPAGAPEGGPSRGARRDQASTLTETSAGLDLLADLAEVASFPTGLDPALDEACRRIRVATGAALVGIWERRPGGLVARATEVEGPGPPHPSASHAVRACSHERWRATSRSMRAPATRPPSRRWAWAPTSCWWRSPAARPPGACS